MPAELKLIDLTTRSVDDIPALLEGVAQGIRNGDHGNIRAGAGVFIDHEGEVFVCGWGRDAADVFSIGLLQLGVSRLSARKTVR